MSSLIIDYLLIALTLHMMNGKIPFLQKFLASSMATAFSLLISVLNIADTFLVFIKLILGLIISVICTPIFKLKQLLLFYITFLSFTFLMGGVVFATQCIFSVSISPFVAILIIFAVFVLTKNAIKKFYHTQKLSTFSYDIKIKYKDKSQIVRAYLDSGNLFKDTATSKPIIILDFETFSKCFDVSLLDYLTRNIPDSLSSKYIDIATVGNSSKLLVVDIDDLYLLNGEESVKLSALIGVSLSSHFADGYHALISPLMF